MVTTLYAGILGLIYVALSLYVIKGRFQYRVSLGSGGSEDLEKRIRAHANFIEYVPFALILIFLCELEKMPELMVHFMASLLVMARLLHANALCGNIVAIPNGRQIGMVGTFTVLIISAVYCIKSFFIF
ncbi:MAG: MAPEG family protein [Alphaproteobacteria bacterium]